MVRAETFSSGVLHKWNINGLLYKDSMYLYSREPIAEAICSDMLDLLELNHVSYSLVDNYIGVTSVSKKLSVCKIDLEIVKVSDLILEDDTDTFLELLLDIDDKLGLLNMFIFDALVSNPDRHINNIHLKEGKVIILDNGQALSSMNGFEILPGHWRSQPFEPFHGEQLKFLFSYYLDILEESIIPKIKEIYGCNLNEIIGKYLKTPIKDKIITLILCNKDSILKIYNQVINTDTSISWT